MKNPEVAVIVDIQSDFTEYLDGPLAIPDTGEDYVNEVIARARALKDKNIPIIATKDFHPPHHISFYTTHPGKNAFDRIYIKNKSQTLWPEHCIQGTPGAKILLPYELGFLEVAKAFRVDVESYSAFYDEDQYSTGLRDILRSFQAKKILLFGLATDYCVLETALDGLREGFEVEVFLDLCRGIDPEEIEKAVADMRHAGVILRDSGLGEDSWYGAKGA